MKILNTTKLCYAAISGRLNHPAHSLTHIIKATFDLKNGSTVTIADEQLLLAGDEFYPDDEEQTGSLFYESDFAYIKPKTDTLLVGKCHTPDRQPMKACTSRFSVGKHSKNLAIFGNRYWKKIFVNPGMTEPQAFTEMDLRYERSFGGRDNPNNPIGRGSCKEDVTIADNVMPVPNIQDPDDLISSPLLKKDPAGFGPLNRSWAFRQKKMGTYDKKYLKNRWPWFPDNMATSHFNAAPEDQQITGYLAGNEKLFFENLHPKHSQYQSQLPALRVRCFVRTVDPQTKKRSFEEISLNLDTLWVNMEAEQLVLVWRGWMPILDDEFKELKHVFIMAESLEKKPGSIEQCYELFCKARDEEEEEAGPLKGKKEKEEVKAVNNKKLNLSVGAIASATNIKEIKASTSTDDKNEDADSRITLDNDSIEQKIQNQINEMFEKTGLDFSELPPEAKVELNAYKEKITAQLAEENSDEGLEKKLKENNKVLTNELSKLDLDINNLPPISEKAKAEQLRLHNALGVDETTMKHMSPEMENMWAIMAAVFPKIGVDPENLTPLMEHSQSQFEQLKEHIEPAMSADADAKPDDNEHKEKTQNSDITKIKERAENKDSFCDEVFDGLDLSCIDFSDCDFTGASFAGTTLTDSVFVNAVLTNTIFRGAKLSKANLSQASARQADFTQAEMSHCIAENTDFTKALLTKTKLDQGQFSNSNFSHSNLASCNLNNAILENVVLESADFANSSMTNANFSGANVNNCSFHKVIASKSQWNNISGNDCSFSQADLTDSKFLTTNLSYADFSKATLSSCDFTGSQLTDSFFTEVMAPGINLSQCNLFKIRASHESDFTDAKIVGADAESSMWADAILINADFSESNLQRATFIKADLTRACLFSVDLKFATLDGAKLNSADVRNVNLMQGSLGKADLTHTNFYGSNLYEVEFLDAIISQTVFESANITNTKLEN